MRVWGFVPLASRGFVNLCLPAQLLQVNFCRNFTWRSMMILGVCFIYPFFVAQTQTCTWSQRSLTWGRRSKPPRRWCWKNFLCWTTRAPGCSRWGSSGWRGSSTRTTPTCTTRAPWWECCPCLLLPRGHPENILDQCWASWPDSWYHSS